MRHVERDFASAASVDPAVSADPADFSATELLRLYRTRQLSPAEVARAVLERIERFEPAVNAFCLVDPERAMQAARESEARWQRAQPQGLLDGVPATIKDLILTRGWPTLRGSLTTPREQPWDEDAPATARLREQGAVLIGKTTTPEFGWKAVTDSALTGITRNPWNTARTPGGSSGGAAVACALGMGALHIGTDGGGSIRIPAAFTGIFGLKPSFGRVPAWPLSPFGTLAHIGPMTRCVADAALMLNVLARPDGRDWFALPYDGRDYRTGSTTGSGDPGLRSARGSASPKSSRRSRTWSQARLRRSRSSAPGSSWSTRALPTRATSFYATGGSGPPISCATSRPSSAPEWIRACRRSPPRASKSRFRTIWTRPGGGPSSVPGCACSTSASTCC
jgi:Asp-tRNA(Asn)/Glu-tRNA(Gln) amidotransferase A subunit family amidase